MSVDLTVDGAVAKVVLNRPEKLNALSVEMRESLCELLRPAALRRRGARRSIVTGAGRGFCSGADVDRMAGQQAGSARRPGAPAARWAHLHPRAARDRKAGHRRGARAGRRHRLEHRTRLRPGGGVEDRAVFADLPAHRPGARRRRHLVSDPPARHGARPRSWCFRRALSRPRRRWRSASSTMSSRTTS